MSFVLSLLYRIPLTDEKFELAESTLIVLSDPAFENAYSEIVSTLLGIFTVVNDGL